MNSQSDFTPTDTLNYTCSARRRDAHCQREVATPHHLAGPCRDFLWHCADATQLMHRRRFQGHLSTRLQRAIVLAPGRYTLSASFTPSDTEKYATAQARWCLKWKDR